MLVTSLWSRVGPGMIDERRLHVRQVKLWSEGEIKVVSDCLLKLRSNTTRVLSRSHTTGVLGQVKCKHWWSFDLCQPSGLPKIHRYEPVTNNSTCEASHI